MLVKNPPDDILVNRRPERQIGLIGDVRTSPGRNALFHFDNGGSNLPSDLSAPASFSALVKIGAGIFASPKRDETKAGWMFFERKGHFTDPTHV
jgi:hypothetical protein